MSAALAICVGLILVGAGWFGLFRAKNASSRQRRRLSYAENFFDAANVLASDDETPDEMLEFLSAMNSTIADEDGPRILMSYLTRGHQIRIDNDAPRFRKIVTEFLERRDELKDSWTRAIASWFLAVSYLSWWRGPLLRIAIQDEELIGAARRVKSKSHRKDDEGGFSAGMPHDDKVAA